MASGLDAIGGLAQLGLGGSELFGNQGFQPTGMPFADQEWQNFLSSMAARNTKVPGQVDPQFWQTFQKMLGLDTGPMLTAGSQAGQQYQQLGSMGQGLSQNLMGQGQQIQQQGFDPQNQLHDFLQQQTTDQSRAADSARGLATSPYSSGDESTALRNFNLDWQNRQLGREMAGSQGSQNAYGGAFGYSAGVPNATMASASTPFGVQQGAAQIPGQAAQQYAGNIYGSDPFGGLMQQINPYMQNTFGIFGADPQFRAGQQQTGLTNMLGGLQQIWPMISGAFDGMGGAIGGAAAGVGGGVAGSGAGDLASTAFLA